MVVNKTSRRQHDTPTKNRFIGAMEATGELCESANLVGMKPSTTSRLWKKYQETGSTKNRPRSGRPLKLTERGKRLVQRNCLKERRKPFEQIALGIAGKVSKEIIRKAAAEDGLHQRVARQVPMLNPLQARKRLKWAQDHDDLDVQEWDNLMSSDECYIELDSLKGRIYVTRRAGEEFDENCLVPKVKQSPIKVMVWGCVMRGIKGPLVVLEYPGGKGGGFIRKNVECK